MGIFDRFKDKGRPSYRDLKRLNDNLDIGGLLRSIDTVEITLMPYLLDLIGELVSNKPMIARTAGADLAKKVIGAPVEGDPIAEDKWLSLCIVLIDHGHFESMLKAGLASKIKCLIGEDRDRDWKIFFLIGEISRTPQGQDLADDLVYSYLLGSLDRTDEVNIPYIIAALDYMTAAYGAVPLVRLDAMERFRNLTIHPDRNVSVMARTLMGRCERSVSKSESQGSLFATESTVMTAGECVAGGRKKEGISSGEGYIRPERGRTARRSQVVRVAEEQLDDLSSRKRRVDPRFETEIKEALEREMDGIYSGEEEFEIEE